jgi:hypothetical protein
MGVQQEIWTRFAGQAIGCAMLRRLGRAARRFLADAIIGLGSPRGGCKDEGCHQTADLGRTGHERLP